MGEGEKGGGGGERVVERLGLSFRVCVREKPAIQCLMNLERYAKSLFSL